MNATNRKIRNVGVMVLILAVSIPFTGFSQGWGNGNGPGGGKGFRHGWKASQDSSGPGMGQACRNIPGITEQQAATIEKSRLQYQKDILSLQNQKAEKKARYRTLSTTDKVDQKAINQVIDEIASLNAQIAKRKSQHQQEIRSVLTDEQRIFFDTRGGKGRKNGKGSGKGRGVGRGNGDCPYQR